MRFEHEGISLWYGTPDTPAPSNTVLAGAEIRITIGVQPPDASNRILVLYRANHGSQESVTPRWLRSDAARRAQYFEARLGPFRVGDTVEYVVTCTCAGKTVPSREDLTRAYVSFRVTGNGADNTQSTLPEQSGSSEPLVRLPTSAANVAGRVVPSLVASGLNGGAPVAVRQPDRSNDVIAVERSVECEPVRQRLFTVKGQVRHADRSTYPRCIVRLFNKGLRNDGLLSETITNDCGDYEATYTRAEKNSAAVVVRALTREGALLAESPVIFSPKTLETVDLVIGREEYREPSEYERHLAAVKPYLIDGDGREIPMTELTQDEEHQDVTLLSGKTGIPPRSILHLILAARHGNKTGLLPEVFYGFFRQGLPTNLPALLVQRPRRQREALQRSLRDNIIPAELGKDLDRILEALQHLIAKHVFRPEEPGSFVLGDLLDTSAIPQTTQVKFLSLYLQHEGHIEDFWQTLRGHADFQAAGLVDTLQFTLQLGLLTQQNIPLVTALQGLRRKGSLPSLRDVARTLEARAWTELIEKSAGREDGGIPAYVPGATKEERVTYYVNGIIEALKDAFPTTFVAIGVAQTPTIDSPLVRQALAHHPQLDLDEPLPDTFEFKGIAPVDQAKAHAAIASFRREIKMFPEFDYKRALAAPASSGIGRSTFENPVRKGVARFFANEPDFEFANTHIDTYLTEHATTAFNGIPEQERPAVTRQLKALQRVARVAPRYEHMEALLGEGHDSAFRIGNIPRPRFVQQFGNLFGGDTIAEACHDRASLTTTTMAMFTAGANDFLNGVEPKAMMNDEAKEEAIKIMPTLKDLFGSLDLCECEHCRSVYSPAAYFVDLFQFLRRGGTTTYNALRQRRPDLEHIKLTCENTNTLLPYVDLMSEILEFYVVHHDFAVVSQDEQLSQELAKDTGDISAEELSVNPQYTLDAAYEELRKAVHAFVLPFNRPVEVARAYLEHLGSSRYAVMSTFQSQGQPIDPNDPTSPIDPMTKTPLDLALACESLKIAPEEYDILVGEIVGGKVLVANSEKLPRAFFGYSEAKDTVAHVYIDSDGKTGTENETWSKNLSRVPEFLRRTGISYLELVELTKTRFINPGYGAWAFIQQHHIDYADLAEFKANNFANPSANLQTTVQEAGISIADFATWVTTNVQKIQELIVLYAPGSACDLSITTIQHLDGSELSEGEWLRLHRFLRLWRKVDWSMQEVDKAIHALGASDLDQSLIEKLAHLEQLRVALNQPIVNLLGLWAPIDTFGEDALYRQLFQNKAVLNPVDLDFALNADASELNDTSKTISASFQLTEQSLSELAGENIPATILTTLEGLKNTVYPMEGGGGV